MRLLLLLELLDPLGDARGVFDVDAYHDAAFRAARPRAAPDLEDGALFAGPDAAEEPEVGCGRAGAARREGRRVQGDVDGGRGVLGERDPGDQEHGEVGEGLRVRRRRARDQVQERGRVWLRRRLGDQGLAGGEEAEERPCVHCCCCFRKPGQIMAGVGVGICVLVCFCLGL